MTVDSLPEGAVRFFQSSERGTFEAWIRGDRAWTRGRDDGSTQTLDATAVSMMRGHEFLARFHPGVAAAPPRSSALSLHAVMVLDDVGEHAAQAIPGVHGPEIVAGKIVAHLGPAMGGKTDRVAEDLLG